MQIHVHRDSEEMGIFSQDETTQHLAEGHLLESDLACHEGLEEWIPVGELLKQLQEKDKIKAKGDPVVKRQKRMALVSGVMGVVALAMGALAIWAWSQRTEAEKQRTVAMTKQQEAETVRDGEVKKRKNAETELKEAHVASVFMWGIAEAVMLGEHGDANDKDKDLQKLLLSKVAERIKELEGQPKAEGPIRIILGEAYGSLAFYDEALVHHKRALALRLKLFDPNHPSVAKSYGNIGNVHGQKGEHDKALEYLGKALAIRLKILGPDHPEVATSYNDIGRVHNAKGEPDKALENSQKALTIQLKQLVADPLLVAASYWSIGTAWENKNDLPKAKEYYEKAHAIYRKEFGPDNQSTKYIKAQLDRLTQEMTPPNPPAPPKK